MVDLKQLISFQLIKFIKNLFWKAFPIRSYLIGSGKSTAHTDFITATVVITELSKSKNSDHKKYSNKSK